MALQNTINFKGFSLISYIKIDSIIFLHQNIVQMQVSCYANRNEETPIHTIYESFSCDIGDEISYQKCYEYLKTLPEFSSSLDV